TFSTTSPISSRTISFSPLISVSIVSGEASAVLIRSLFTTIGRPLSRVNSIITNLLRWSYRHGARKVKKIKPKLRKCPRRDIIRDPIKSINAAPKKGPDASVPSRQQLPTVVRRWGHSRNRAANHRIQQGEPHVPGCLEQPLRGVCGEQPQQYGQQPFEDPPTVVFGVQDQLRRRRRCRPFTGRRP